jgi:hypothetical protein
MTESRRGRGQATGVGSTGTTDIDEAAARIADLEARLARIERQPGMRTRGRRVVDQFMPAEASQHFRNAGREQLLGLRAIVDHWISRIEERDAAARGDAPQHETITIE